MNDIRARFEEIWPVPRGCMWTDDRGYLPIDKDADHLIDRCIEHDARLETFTRCQETTAIHLSLIEELVADVRYRAYHDADDDDDEKSKALLHRINQIMEQKK